MTCVPPAEVFDARTPRLAAPLLPATIGIYACVPETNAVRPLLGAFGIAPVLALSPRLQTLPVAASAAVGRLAWAAVAGGYFRPDAAVGGLACVGMIAICPALAAAHGARRWLVGGVLLALVLFCARVAGFEESAWEAAALCILAFAGRAAVYATSR